MILTNAQLRKRIAEDLAHFVVDRISNKYENHIHHAMPDSRSISRNGLMPDARSRINEELFIPKKEYFSMYPTPEEGQLGISGFDIRFGKFVAWTDTVRQDVAGLNLMDLPHKILEPGEKFILNHDSEGGKVYYVTSFESISLPSDLEMIIDSKSTTGRVGAMSHGVGQTSKREIVTMIQPYSFPLEITCGKTSLSQAVIRFRNSQYMDVEKILSGNFVKLDSDGQSLEENLTSNGLSMKFATRLIYRAKKCDTPIDMDAKKTINPKDYWEKIEGKTKIKLDAKTLYLLGSLGKIELGASCGLLSREEEVLTGTGTWGHFAGIFQPFWKGGVTMEVYGFGKREIFKGDRAGVVKFDEVELKSEGIYNGTYQNQKPPMLPRMFREFP